ncbi:MAG: hypothetical protein K8R68_10505, partial [Bacteroidales bacterium]|nr:hypothetical protein [Bacteroidales bacterium]
MRTILEDFRRRVNLTQNINYSESRIRLAGLYEWMLTIDEIKKIIESILSENEIVVSDKLKKIPSTPSEIAAFGIYLLKRISEGTDLFRLSTEFNINPSYSTKAFQDYADAVIDRYINPTFEMIDEELEIIESESESNQQFFQTNVSPKYPLEIYESLQKFFTDYPDFNRNAFIMMKFGDTKAHNSILLSIRSILNKYGINALRADEKEYHEDLFPNVLTYLHGCKFGIAVFERLEEEEFNPNVSLEVGYLRALKKPICLLKDK